jgi:hypothetical protein
VDVTAGDGLAKMIGLQPSKVAEKSRRIGEVYADTDMRNNKEAEIADKWARGKFENDPEAVAAARRQLEEWNKDNPELRIRINPVQIQTRVKSLRMSREERFIKRAAPEIRRDVRERLTQP